MEKGTLHELQMKKKKMKHNLCYFGLVVLIILLALPPSLRSFIKDPEEEKEKEKKKEETQIVYTTLNCSKGDETISSTFKNEEPQSILYRVKGNLVDNKPDETDTAAVGTYDNQNIVDNNTSSVPQDITDSSGGDTNTFDKLSVYEVLSNVMIVTYDENENVSYIKVGYGSLTPNKEYENTFSTISAQEAFFTSKGFTCTQTKI